MWQIILIILFNALYFKFKTLSGQGNYQRKKIKLNFYFNINEKKQESKKKLIKL